MGEFLYIYRGGARAQSPEEGERVMQKWVAWMQDLGRDGHMKDRGQPLDPGGKVVRGKEKNVTDGPYAETKDVVGGYTVIEAKDLHRRRSSRRAARSSSTAGSWKSGPS